MCVWKCEVCFYKYCINIDYESVNKRYINETHICYTKLNECI